MGLELTRRDLALLWVTWQSRLMAPRQYLRRFWSGATHQAASKRLTHLKNEGLLQCAHFPWAGDRSIYTITTAGNRALIEAGLLTPTLAHDFLQRPQEMTKALVDALRVVGLCYKNRCKFGQVEFLGVDWRYHNPSPLSRFYAHAKPITAALPENPEIYTRQGSPRA